MVSSVTKSKGTSTEKHIGIITVILLLFVIFIAAYLTEADGYKQSGQLEKTPQTFYIRGDLSEKTQEKFYGGDIIGEFTIIVNVNDVKILASLDDYTQHRIMDAWLIDSNTDQMINIGTFDGNKLTNNITIKIWSYNVILITEKIYDENSKIDVPIGGSLLEKEPEYKSCKCG